MMSLVSSQRPAPSLKGTTWRPGRCHERVEVISSTCFLKEESEEETESGDESEDEPGTRKGKASKTAKLQRVQPRSRTWDCETVLSTLSNVSNRPGGAESFHMLLTCLYVAVASAITTVSGRQDRQAEDRQEAGGEAEAVKRV